MDTCIRQRRHNSKNKYAAHDTSPESFQRSLARAVQKEPSQTVLRSGHAEVNDVTNEPLLPQHCYSSSIAIAPTIYKTRSPISCATYLTNDPLVVPSLYPKMETMNRWPMGSHPFKNNFLPLLRDQHTSEKQNPYRAIAQHYGWALQRVFTTSTFEREEDLHISPDFLPISKPWLRF